MSGRGDPIFIGGLARSGKTQLRIVLEALPRVSMTRRTYMWDRFYGRFGDLARPRNLDRCLAVMEADPGVQQLEPDLARIRREFLEEGPATYARLFGLFHAHHAERLGKPRWGDQLAFVERFADPIFETFPQARMIHMIRDPRSLIEPGRSERRRPGSVGWVTGKWLRSADLAERNLRRHPAGYRVVRYEAFAAHPVETVQQLCSFLDEEYVPIMSDVLSSVRFDVGGGEDHGAVRTERSAQRVPAEVAFVDAYARRKLVAFEYPVTPSKPQDRLAYALVVRPVNHSGLVMSLPALNP